MIREYSKGEKVFDLFNVLFMLLMIVVTAYPFLYVAFSSISQADKLIGHSGLLLAPKGFSLEAYELVIKNPSIATGYRTTLIVVTIGTAFNIFMTSLGAYVLSRKILYFKKFFMVMIIFTMFFHGGLIPNYLLINNILHLKNNLLALILPGAISTWNLIVMRTNFMTIPDSLEESAKIDGANDFTVLFRIILPLSKPIIAVMVLFYGVAHWNSWFGALLYLRERKLYPLQLILREIIVLSSTESMMTSVGTGDKESVSETIKYATIMVATLPVLLIYPFVQKYFVKGMLVGAVKG